MTKTRKPSNTYSREFKLEAIRLMKESDRTSAQVANELGIRRNQLYKWKEQLETKGEESLTSKRGRPRKEDQSEISSLRQEGEILKKAAVLCEGAQVKYAFIRLSVNTIA